MILSFILKIFLFSIYAEEAPHCKLLDQFIFECNSLNITLQHCELLHDKIVIKEVINNYQVSISNLSTCKKSLKLRKSFVEYKQKLDLPEKTTLEEYVLITNDFIKQSHAVLTILLSELPPPYISTININSVSINTTSTINEIRDQFKLDVLIKKLKKKTKQKKATKTKV